MKLPITREQTVELVRRIRGTGLPYLLVGGQAVAASSVYAQTDDLDVMVAVRDFDEIIRRLGKDPTFGTPDRAAWDAKYEVHLGPRLSDYVEVDLLNGKKYAGRLSPDAFFDYLMASWSSPSDLGPSARVPAVWYMRLMVRDSGELYVFKVVRDIRAGASPEMLHGVSEIARHLGTETVVQTRVVRVREILEEAGP